MFFLNLFILPPTRENGASGIVGAPKIILQTDMPPSSQPHSDAGYVAGRYTLEKKVFATAFVLTNLQTSQEYVLPFTSKSDYSEGNTETGLVALPPGQYKATHWIVYNTFWGPNAGGREFKQPIADSNFTAPFALKAGEVVSLGRFVASNEWQIGYRSSTTSGHWVAQRLSLPDARQLLQAAYPSFAGLGFRCLACIQ